jgi:hypothetical protein
MTGTVPKDLRTFTMFHRSHSVFTFAPCPAGISVNIGSVAKNHHVDQAKYLVCV